MNTIGDAIEKWEQWECKKWYKKYKEGIVDEGYPNLKFEKEIKEKIYKDVNNLYEKYIKGNEN